MFEHLQHLAANGPSWAAQRAQMALEIAGQYQQGGISADEYRELMLDLVRADRLDAEATDLDTKTLLVNAIYAVAQVA
jgi:hypothetical protein